MRILIMVLTLILLTSFACAENKIYYDYDSKKEVCDLSGAKTIQQINSEFNGNFIDITAERKLIEVQNAIDAENKIKDIQLKHKSASDKLEALGLTKEEIDTL